MRTLDKTPQDKGKLGGTRLHDSNTAISSNRNTQRQTRDLIIRPLTDVNAYEND